MEEVINNTFGTLSSAPDNTIINNIYTYLASVLSDFKGKSDENENAITNRLCKRLNAKRPSEFSIFIIRI